MRKTLLMAACAAGFLLIAAPIYMNQESHLFLVNGKPFSTAMRVNGVWAIPLEDVQKNVDGAFAVVGNRVVARDPASGLPTGQRMHKPFVMTKEWSPSTPLLTGPGGKQYISLSEVGTLFDTTFIPPPTLAPGASMSLNFTKITFKYVKMSN